MNGGESVLRRKGTAAPGWHLERRSSITTGKSSSAVRAGSALDAARARNTLQSMKLDITQKYEVRALQLLRDRDTFPAQTSGVCSPACVGETV